jgi:hypothetical protein
MYDRSMMILLALSLVATSCATGDGQELTIGEKQQGHFESYFPTATRGLHQTTVNVEYMVAGREPCSPNETK